MNAPNCPKCGGPTRDTALGWICKNCRGFIDMQGNFHEHIDRPFLPPSTNADRLMKMNEEDLAKWLIEITIHGHRPWCDFHCRKNGKYGCDKCALNWLQQTADKEV